MRKLIKVFDTFRMTHIIFAEVATIITRWLAQFSKLKSGKKMSNESDRKLQEVCPKSYSNNSKCNNNTNIKID